MEHEKYVDESWKESVAQEKEKANAPRDTQPAAPAEEPAAPAGHEQAEEENRAEPESQESSSAGQVDVNFVNYLTGLGYQAMIFLGEIPNPLTRIVEKNLEQAKFLIDTLVMLREKTKGNLSEQESNLLNTTIYELQMRYIEISQKEAQELSDPRGGKT